MQKNQFENVSDDTLLKEQKKLKNLNKIYGIVLIFIFFAAIYLAFAKEKFAMVIVCTGLFSIYVVNHQSLNDFKKEVAKRNLN